jgi:bacillolysin
VKKSHRIGAAVLILLLVNIVTLGVSLTTAQPGAAQRLAYHNQTGKVTFIGATVANPIIVPGAVARDMTAAARADAVLNVYATQFGVNAQDLSFARDFTTRGGIISRRYQQMYGGVPVFGAQIVVNMTTNGGLVSMLGEASPDLAVSVTPTLTAQQAQQIALLKAEKQYKVSANTLSASTPSLAIYDQRLVTNSRKAPVLVWNVEVISIVGAPIRATALIDAQNGQLPLFFNQIDAHPVSNSIPEAYQINLPQTLALPQSNAVVQPRVPGTADLATYDGNNLEALPGVFACDETQQPCTTAPNTDEALDSIHLFSKETYDLYYDWHGRDSYDNAGLQIISTGHFGAPDFCNAFYDGTQTAYYDGCGGLWRDDVVAHEMTHGVTDYTSGLIYAYESGAINESFSDVWGEYYDLSNNTVEDTPENRWRVGEETDFSEFGLPTPGIRDMKDPTIFQHPDKMTSEFFYIGSGDNGGVHINSGVNNKAAYLLADGGTFNGQTVAPIGMMKAAAIYYDVQTTKLTASSDYGVLANAMEQSCTELIGGAEGITAADCAAVQAAVLATEMRLDGGPVAKTADLCETGFANHVFNDGLENGGGNWVTASISGSNAWTIASTNDPLIGNASNFGANLATTSASYVAMNADVTVPANGFLHFSHSFNFEADGVYYDGGIVEYSTNGGAAWTQVPSAGFFEEGIDYIGSIDTSGTNPLEGKTAFVGYSGGGVGSTRYNLSSLAGQSVRFRWVIGTDQLIGADGWRVDNIQIYACTDQPPTATPTTDPNATPTPTPTQNPGTELLSNGGFEDGLAPWKVKNATSDKVKCNKPDKLISRTGDCAFMFKGGAGENSKLSQNANLTGVSLAVGVSVDMDVYAKATNAATNATVKLIVKYSDGTLPGKLSKPVPVGADYANVFDTYGLASTAVSKMKLQIQNKSAAGKLYVDDASVNYTGGMGFTILPLPVQ